MNMLLCALRRIGLAHTQFVEATCGTLMRRTLTLTNAPSFNSLSLMGRHGIGLSLAGRVRTGASAIGQRHRLTRNGHGTDPILPTAPLRWR